MARFFKPRICLDFDGVLYPLQPDGKYTRSISVEVKPIPNSVESVESLSDEFDIVLHTSRIDGNPGSNERDIRSWLSHYGFRISDISPHKPSALLYIDDRGYRFTGWDTDLENIYRQAKGNIRWQK